MRLCNLYAPNTPGDRKEFFISITECLVSCSLIICGDFYFGQRCDTEERADSQGDGHDIIFRRDDAPEQIRDSERGSPGSRGLGVSFMSAEVLENFCGGEQKTYMELVLTSCDMK